MIVKNENNQILRYEKGHDLAARTGPKTILFLNTCFVIMLIFMYYYVAYPVTAVQVYICIIGIFSTTFLYYSGFNNKIEIYVLAFGMVCLNEFLFGILNLSTKYLVTVITCEVVFYIWPLIYAIVLKTYKRKRIMVIIAIALSVFLITAYNTNIGLDVYPFASRSLAGFATQSEQLFFAKMGIGGYGFVYAGVFIVPAMIFCVLKMKNMLFKIAILLISIFEMYVVIKADYAIAASIIILLIISLFTYNNKPFRIIMLGLLLFLMTAFMLLFGTQILEHIGRFAYDCGQFTVANKFSMLSQAIEMNKVYEIRRIVLYIVSLKTIFKYPIIGGMWFSGAEYGRHSGLLDYIAQFGVGSIWLFVYFSNAFSVQIKSLTNEKLKTGLRVVHFYFYILIAVNMFLIYVEIAIAVFFIVPLIFWLTDQELLRKKESDLKLEHQK